MISVTVCRGCCCGTARKHPETDHDGQLRQLAEAGVRVRVVAECLGPCEHSNVMVVHPSYDRRRLGARVVWLGGVLDSRLLVHIGRWAARGGPGAAAIPEAVRPFVIARPTPTRPTPTRPTRSRAAAPTGLGWPHLVDQALAAPELAGQELAASDLVDQAFAAPQLAGQELAASDLVDQALAAPELAGQGLAASDLVDQALAALQVAGQALALPEVAGQGRGAGGTIPGAAV